MTTELQKNGEYKLPTIAELFEETGNLAKAERQEALTVLLNNDPPKTWIKEHPYIKGWMYVPIDKVELMLDRIFKKYNIEILREGVAFNACFVVVRVHYFNPAIGAMMYHDGIGACELQTKKGASPADLNNINRGAVSMAFPIAKSLAVKDATDHLGRVFGRDLNRKDIAPFKPNEELLSKYKNAVTEPTE
jgi:hypothetical protein